MIEWLAIFAAICMACAIAYCLGYIHAEERLRPPPTSDRMQSVWGDVASPPAGFKSSSHNRGDTL